MTSQPFRVAQTISTDIHSGSIIISMWSWCESLRLVYQPKIEAMAVPVGRSAAACKRAATRS